MKSRKLRTNLIYIDYLQRLIFWYKLTLIFIINIHIFLSKIGNCHVTHDPTKLPVWTFKEKKMWNLFCVPTFCVHRHISTFSKLILPVHSYVPTFSNIKIVLKKMANLWKPENKLCWWREKAWRRRKVYSHYNVSHKTDLASSIGRVYIAFVSL